MIDIEKLKGLAEAATPSKWSVSGSYIAPTREESGTTYVENWRSIALVSHDADRDFIAAANPAAVLELIESFKRVDDELSACKEGPGTCGYWRDAARAHLADIDKLKAENEALRTVLRRVEKCTDGDFMVDGKWRVGDNIMRLVRKTLWPKASPGGAVAEWQEPMQDENDAAMTREQP